VGLCADRALNRFPPWLRQISEQLLTVDEWTFNILRVAELAPKTTLTIIGTHLFEEHALLERFRIAPAVLAKFLAAIEQRYNDMPYHNAVHGADVAQTMHYFLHHGGMDAWLPDVMVLSALTAALVHDVVRKLV